MTIPLFAVKEPHYVDERVGFVIFEGGIQPPIWRRKHVHIEILTRPG